MKNSNIPFCKVPFLIGFTTYSNLYRDCCSKKPYLTSTPDQNFDQWWNSKNLLNFKKSLQNSNDWPEECWACKTAEDHSGHSFRLAVNKWSESDYRYPCAWNISFGNICNLGCWSCNEESSSVIFQHKKQAGMIDGEDIYNSRFNEKWPELEANILKSYDYHENVNLTILGGEPLYNPVVKEFLNKLIDNNLAYRTKLEFHTNGTVYPDKILSPLDESLWNHVCIFISLDASGTYAEWLRYGCKWNKVDKTVDKLIESSNYTEIHCTLSVLNINQLGKLEDYAKSKNCELRIHPVGQPDFMALKHWDLPMESLLVNPVDEKYQNYYNLIGTEPKIGSSDRLVNYIRNFDGVRKPLSDFDKEFAEKIGW